MNAIQKYAFSLLSKEDAMEHFGLVEAEAKEEAPKEKFGEARLEGEDDVFIYFPGDELTVGSPVFSDEGGEEPLVAGEYILDGGVTIVVNEEGMVAEINEAGDEEEPVEEDAQREDDEKKDYSDLEAFFAPHLEAFEALSTLVGELQEQLQALSSDKKELNSKVESLSKASAAVYKPNAKVASKPNATQQVYRNLTAKEKLQAKRK